MHVNLKPNKHKIISFNTTTTASFSLGFIAAPPPPKILGPPLNLAPQVAPIILVSKFSP